MRRTKIIHRSNRPRGGGSRKINRRLRRIELYGGRGMLPLHCGLSMCKKHKRNHKNGGTKRTRLRRRTRYMGGRKSKRFSKKLKGLGGAPPTSPPPVKKTGLARLWDFVTSQSTADAEESGRAGNYDLCLGQEDAGGSYHTVEEIKRTIKQLAHNTHSPDQNKAQKAVAAQNAAIDSFKKCATTVGLNTSVTGPIIKEFEELRDKGFFPQYRPRQS